MVGAVTGKNFREWNEGMLKKHRLDDYYLHSHQLVILIEKCRIGAVLRFINAAPGDFILDLGCGNGYVLDSVTAGILFGVDISETILRSSALKIRERFRLVAADGQQLPFKDKTFNKVFCTEVIEHVYNPEMLMDEIARITKPKGKIVLSVPNEGLINALKWALMEFRIYGLFFKKSGYCAPLKMDEEWHLRTFTLSQFKAVFKKKFIIEKVSLVPSVFMPLRYVISAAKKD